MDKAMSIAAFDQAATFCREFAQQLVIEERPPTTRFDFAAASREQDQNRLVTFHGGRLLRREQLRGVEWVQARKYLWVDGKVPLWINLNVHAADAESTYIEVSTCHRLTDNDRVLYHQKEGNPPFHIPSPPLPRGWASLEESGKFSLRWQSAE